MKINNKLAILRKMNKLSQSDVAKNLCSLGFNVKNYTVSRWESGERQPNLEEFFALCELYNVNDIKAVFENKETIGTVSYFSTLIKGNNSQGKTLNSSDEDIFSGLNLLGIQTAKKYIEYLKADSIYNLHENYNTRIFVSKDENDKSPEEYNFYPEKENSTVVFERVIKLYDLPVSAGTGSFLDSDSYVEISVNESVPLDTSFAVRVRGDSMTPKIHDNQIVFIKKQNTINDGEIGIFSLNGDAYCKKLVGNQLVSLNEKYLPVSINDFDDFFILGKVISGQL
jgi:Predicted transcriptional regulator